MSEKPLRFKPNKNHLNLGYIEIQACHNVYIPYLAFNSNMNTYTNHKSMPTSPIENMRVRGSIHLL